MSQREFQDVQLSGNFWLSEFVRSKTADARGIDNRLYVGDPEHDRIIANLRALCVNTLQPLRDFYDRQIHVSSGWRSPALNEVVGGSRTSQHVDGEAGDIEIFGVDNLEVAQNIQQYGKFDQLILEFYRHGDPSSGWIHVSYTDNPRFEVLSKLRGERGYRPGLVGARG